MSRTSYHRGQDESLPAGARRWATWLNPKPRTDEAVRKVICPRFYYFFVSASEPSQSVPSAKLVLAKALKSCHKKGHCNVASLWIRGLDDRTALGMCDGEWYSPA
jgi:hypothetical protein